MRYENWPEKLDAAIEEYRYKDFEWGENDCALFASNVVATYTGKNFAKKYIGSYSNELDARRTLKEIGYKDLKKLVDSLLPSISITYAGRGDVVMYKKSLGICLGEQSAFLWQSGLTFQPTLQCTHAWRIE